MYQGVWVGPRDHTNAIAMDNVGDHHSQGMIEPVGGCLPPDHGVPGSPSTALRDGGIMTLAWPEAVPSIPRRSVHRIMPNARSDDVSLMSH